MADSVAYIRDAKTGLVVPVKLLDETGSYSCTAVVLAELTDGEDPGRYDDR